MDTLELRRQGARRGILALSFDLAHTRLNELEEYSRRSEEWLGRESVNIRVQVRGQTLFMNPEDERTQHYIDAMAEDISQVEETFPQIFRTSLFIQCCSDFEHVLMRIAKRFEGNIPTKLADLRNDAGIRKAQTYLRHYAGVKFPDETPLWTDILLLSELRNVAVHANRTVPEAPKNDKHRKLKLAVDTAVRRWPDDVSIDRFHQFALSSAFVARVLTIHRGFLTELRARVFAQPSPPAPVTASATSVSAACP